MRRRWMQSEVILCAVAVSSLEGGVFMPRRLYVLLRKVLVGNDVILLEVVVLVLRFLDLEGLVTRLDDGPLEDGQGGLELEGTEAVAGRPVGCRPNLGTCSLMLTRGIALQVLRGRCQGSLL